MTPMSFMERGEVYRATLSARGNECELCHQPQNDKVSLFVIHINHDFSDFKPENLAVLCSSCESIFRMSNPDGLTREGGLFAFAINRGLYPPLKKDDPGKG